MKDKDINSLEHTSWRCQYHIVFAMIFSITHRCVNGVTEAYIRIGNESVVADATELKRLVMRGRKSSYDSLMSPYNLRTFLSVS